MVTRPQPSPSAVQLVDRVVSTTAEQQHARDELLAYVADCEEANALLDFAEGTPVAIEWGAGTSLRDALRTARGRAGQ